MELVCWLVVCTSKREFGMGTSVLMTSDEARHRYDGAI